MVGPAPLLLSPIALSVLLEAIHTSVDTNTCDGCETRTDRCQVDAIQIENDLATVSVSKFIGSRLCVSTCPNESISTPHKHPDAMSQIYANDSELMQARAEDTKRPYPFE